MPKTNIPTERLLEFQLLRVCNFENIRGDIVELIIWGAGAGLLGILLGYIGYFHSKLAYSVFTVCVSAMIFSINTLVELTGGDTAALANAEPNASIFALGPLAPIMSAIDKMGYLPFHVQAAILIVVVTFFLSRIATWAYKSYGPKKAEETPAERRARVLKSYGMKSMDDVRSLR